MGDRGMLATLAQHLWPNWDVGISIKVNGICVVAVRAVQLQLATGGCCCMRRWGLCNSSVVWRDVLCSMGGGTQTG
jgi:hypothetical protein